MPTIFKKKRKKINYPKNERNSETQKIYNSRLWKHLRLWYIKNNPLCVECLKENKIVLAEEIDHIKEISSGRDYQEKLSLTLDINNLQSLCRMHHHKKHLKDSN